VVLKSTCRAPQTTANAWLCCRWGEPGPSYRKTAEGHNQVIKHHLNLDCFFVEIGYAMGLTLCALEF
jgi:hypothetical protein